MWIILATLPLLIVNVFGPIAGTVGHARVPVRALYRIPDVRVVSLLCHVPFTTSRLCHDARDISGATIATSITGSITAIELVSRCHQPHDGHAGDVPHSSTSFTFKSKARIRASRRRASFRDEQ
jgi:hypothetical protein